MSTPDSPFVDLIRDVAESPASDFYKIRWGAERSFESLPTVSREDFLRTPLSSRRYKTEKALVKIVRDPAGMFLSEWAFGDTVHESYGIVSARPLVYMENSGETHEKSMWCYGRGVVPLAGEKDPDIAMYAAGKYRINSMITDAASIVRFRPYLESHEPLESISILGTEFDTSVLAPFASFAKTVRLVLALPETGAFAESSLASQPKFVPLPGCFIEGDETLVISKSARLVTPVIRYRTNIPERLCAKS